MKRLKRIIRQSFVNPIIDFLPLLAFNVVDNFWGLQPALYIALPISIYLSFYFFFKQPLVYGWHSFSSFVLLSIGFWVALLARTLQVDELRAILVELVTVVTLFIVLELKDKIKQFLLKSSNTLPMENNIDEFFRVSKILIFVSMLHILGQLMCPKLIPVTGAIEKHHMEFVIKCIYTGFVVLVVIYEAIRVYFIRRQLFQEEWWPIVNREGGVIGSIEKALSISSLQKYTHPVVRIAIISQNKLLLRKRGKKDEFFSNVWDITISEHLKYGETVEACMERTLYEAIDFKDYDKAEYKSSYMVESKSDNEIMFFYVIQLDQEVDFDLSKEYGDSLKWWTTQQIDDNIGLGIFAEPFMKEYPYLHHKGLVGKSVSK